MSAAKDLLAGFLIAIAAAAVATILLAVTFFGFEAPSDLKQSLLIALAATSVVLVFAGGEIAFSFLFSWKTPIGVKIMHFLGAVIAIICAYLLAPIALDALDASDKEKCRMVTDINIGPINFTREKCEK